MPGEELAEARVCFLYNGHGIDFTSLPCHSTAIQFLCDFLGRAGSAVKLAAVLGQGQAGAVGAALVVVAALVRVLCAAVAEQVQSQLWSIID